MDDYIKREAVLMKLMQDRCSAKNLQSILDVPVADVAPVVHSHWEYKITDDGENIGICHNCKYPVSWFWEQAKYCPSCGAKMEVDHEDD
jgi:rRNA maturation endonuclease Nob1